MEALRENLLILISTPIYLMLIGLELLVSNYQAKRVYTWTDTLANIYLMLLNSGIDLAFRVVYFLIWGVAFSHRVYSWETGPAYWLTLLVAMDFIFYWLHRMEHMVRLFWAVHVTHHSSDQFNFTVGFRSSVLQPLYRFLFFLPLAFLGFKPLDIAFMFSATQTWGILVHTRLIGKLGFLEHFLVTPSHHRVHHASNPRYLDKNMGMLLIIWDKLFGTFQQELDEAAYQPIRYGLTTPLQDPDMGNLVIHEWKAIATDLRKEIPGNLKWKYVFSPPGWSHDGSRRTSEELRKAETDNQV
jgi:sterol desaturase/sphingolipid hydroxylase (fatty acid hydroxylase superfamily)